MPPVGFGRHCLGRGPSARPGRVRGHRPALRRHGRVPGHRAPFPGLREAGLSRPHPLAPPFSNTPQSSSGFVARVGRSRQELELSPLSILESRLLRPSPPSLPGARSASRRAARMAPGERAAIGRAISIAAARGSGATGVASRAGPPPRRRSFARQTGAPFASPRRPSRSSGTRSSAQIQRQRCATFAGDGVPGNEEGPFAMSALSAVAPSTSRRHQRSGGLVPRRRNSWHKSPTE